LASKSWKHEVFGFELALMLAISNPHKRGKGG
jgi:hypothetical protein